MQTPLANSRVPGVSEDCLTQNVWAVLSSLLADGGNDPSLSEIDDAVKRLLSASRQIRLVAWARENWQAGGAAMRGKPGTVSACQPGRAVALASRPAQRLATMGDEASA